MGTDKNPTPPAGSASDIPPEQGGPTGAAPSVGELLAAARGDVAKRDTAPQPSSTHAHVKAQDVAAQREVPAETPAAARVSPATGASKTTSTPTPSVNKGMTRAAAGPLVQSTPDPPINKLRRRIVWASIASFLSVSFLMFLRFFLPRAIFEPSSIFPIGFPGDYNFGVDTKYQQQYRIWVVRNSERLFVIYAVCTHLGCTPDWKASENKFKCPCHGSGYDSEGINFEGPAPRPMDRAEVALDAEGRIVVNVGKLYSWPKGGENQFDEEKSYIQVS